MLDDLREVSSFDEELPPIEPREYQTRRHFLGMTPAQRFVIVLILMILTFVLSTMCLIVTEKMTLPIF